MNFSGAEPVDNSGGRNEKIFLSHDGYVRTEIDLPRPPVLRNKSIRMALNGTVKLIGEPSRPLQGVAYSRHEHTSDGRPV
jgi:hypothetical protein